LGSSIGQAMFDPGRLIGNVLLWAALVGGVGNDSVPQEIAAFIADRFSGR